MAGVPERDAPPAPKSDKASDATIRPAASQANVELRSTVGHAGGAIAMGERSTSTPLREQTRTADAGALTTPAPAEKPDDAAKAVIDVNPGDPVNKAPDRMPGTAKPDAPQPDTANGVAPRRNGQIAVLISRKDSKLYVRQNFAPLFDAPVTIAPGDRPLGTHVFTAQVDRNDANVLHWSAVSLPATARQTEQRDADEHPGRRRRGAAAPEMKPLPAPDSATEALDRLTIPADAMARITEALSTGGSIIVSDQGINAGETGEGTDFIVPLR